MRDTAAIGIICKTPKAGASKTRLVPFLGADGAAELAGCFLRDVAASIQAIPMEIGRRGYAVFAPEGSDVELRTYVPAEFGLLCRRDTTLGVVLQGAADHLLAVGHDCVLLVNADSPTLPNTLLIEAIAALRRPGDRVVLGPATDGGYYLIGLKVAHARLFEDVPWSTPAVAVITEQRAAEIGLPVVKLPLWYDVDDAETVGELLAELRGDHPRGYAGGPALATRAFLAQHPKFARQLQPAPASAARA
jgi:uncharacterized protein